MNRPTTRGSAEAILQLVLAYQGANGACLSPALLWKKIVDFVHGGGTALYRLSEDDVNHPDATFLEDIKYLVKAGYLELRSNGDIRLTPLGRCVSFPVSIVPELADLEKAMMEKSDSSSLHCDA